MHAGFVVHTVQMRLPRGAHLKLARLQSSGMPWVAMRQPFDAMSIIMPSKQHQCSLFSIVQQRSFPDMTRCGISRQSQGHLPHSKRMSSRRAVATSVGQDGETLGDDCRSVSNACFWPAGCVDGEVSAVPSHDMVCNINMKPRKLTSLKLIEVVKRYGHKCGSSSHLVKFVGVFQMSVGAFTLV